MLEFEIGFKGRFILEQQCQRMGIDPAEVGNENLDGLVNNIGQALSIYMGTKKAGMFNEGLREYTRAVNDINISPNNSLQMARSFIVIGDKRFYIKKFDQSLKAYGKALDILKKTGRKDPFLECRVRRKQARIMGQSKPHYFNAKKEYKTVIDLATGMDDNYNTALSYVGLGTISWQEENYPAALEHFSRAWVAMEKLGDRSRDEKEGKRKVESIIHMGLADIHLDLQDIERSVNHSEMAIDILLEQENYIAVAKQYKKMRIIYHHKKELQRTVDRYDEAQSRSQGIGTLLMESWTRMNLACLLMEDGKFSLAEEHLSKAYDILSGFECPEAYSKLHFIYAKMHQSRKEFEVSENHYRRSMDYSKGSASPEYFAKAQEGLGTLYVFKGETEKGTELLNSALAWHNQNDNKADAERIKGLLQKKNDYCPVGIAMFECQ